MGRAASSRQVCTCVGARAGGHNSRETAFRRLAEEVLPQGSGGGVNPSNPPLAKQEIPVCEDLAYFTAAALMSSRNERASSEAPPIRPPSMSFWASNSGALAGFIEPP